MDTLPKTLIIVPCYNEEHRIEAYRYAEYAQKNPDVHFLFVNDGSTDGTGTVIADLRNKNRNQIMNLNLSENCGKAEAVRRGFQEAFKREYDYIGYFDADLATPLCSINSLCRLFTSEDIFIVMGSRVRLLGRNIHRRAVRHYIGRIFATLVSIILSIPIYDSQCGAKLFKNDLILRRVFSYPFRTKWIFDVELLGRYKLLTGNMEDHIIEYPLEAWNDVRGSKLAFTDFLKAPFELLKICWFIYAPPGISGYSRNFYRGFPDIR
ncbi:MAG TPA: glycosyltransferase [Syntrophales bacterium]|nr:glycosyltransferase [Syntrophales bacterium]